MKNMTSTFKSNPLPMNRDFVSKQFMGTRINLHRKVKQAKLQYFQHVERKLDIIEIRRCWERSMQFQKYSYAHARSI